MHIAVPKILLHAKGAMKHAAGSNQVSGDHRLKKQPSCSSSRQASIKMASQVPKGHLAVYVVNGNNRSRFVIPLAYLTQPLFQDLLHKAEEEFGFEHPMGGLTLPCTEDDFVSLISHLSGHST